MCEISFGEELPGGAVVVARASREREREGGRGREWGGGGEREGERESEGERARGRDRKKEGATERETLQRSSLADWPHLQLDFDVKLEDVVQPQPLDLRAPCDYHQSSAIECQKMPNVSFFLTPYQSPTRGNQPSCVSEPQSQLHFC